MLVNVLEMMEMRTVPFLQPKSAREIDQDVTGSMSQSLNIGILPLARVNIPDGRAHQHLFLPFFTTIIPLPHCPMRTPSVYSQDDPISAAMRPPPTESDAERRARLFAEAEAKRVSEQIDDDLREERERLKKRKGDVKVRCSIHFLQRIYPPFLQLLLLGQAESGKSTLQKQFQLMYRPHSLDQERSSWKTVIYFNVVHSIKQILTTLEAWDDSLEEDDEPNDAHSLATNRLKRQGLADQPSPSNSLTDGSAIHGSPGSAAHSVGTGSGGHSIPPRDSGTLHIANLRRRLSPLVAMDDKLADRLSDGITVSGSGKGGVYVRSGWQARTIENALGKMKSKRPPTGEKTRESVSQDIPMDPMVQEVGRLLYACEEDVRELWAHPTVKGMIAKRRLKLDEWSELYVFIPFFFATILTYFQLLETYFKDRFSRLHTNHW